MPFHSTGFNAAAVLLDLSRRPIDNLSHDLSLGEAGMVSGVEIRAVVQQTFEQRPDLPVPIYSFGPLVAWTALFVFAVVYGLLW
jgi:hypothetical protein